MNTLQKSRLDTVTQSTSTLDNGAEQNEFNVYIKHRALTANESTRNYLIKLCSFVDDCPGKVSLIGAHAFDTYTYYTVQVSYGAYEHIKERSSQSIQGFQATKMLVENFTEYYPVLAPEPSDVEKDFAKRIVDTLNESNLRHEDAQQEAPMLQAV